MLKVYVDGSFRNGVCEYAGWAFVVVQNGKEVFSSCGLTKEIAKSWNIDGEIEASLQAIKWLDGRDGTIVYDYLGIEKWATGKWKAKSEVGKMYQEKTKGKLANISWEKVKSHSGNKYNDIADRLAEKAIVI